MTFSSAFSSDFDVADQNEPAPEHPAIFHRPGRIVIRQSASLKITRIGKRER